MLFENRKKKIENRIEQFEQLANLDNLINPAQAGQVVLMCQLDNVPIKFEQFIRFLSNCSDAIYRVDSGQSNVRSTEASVKMSK